MGLLYLYLGTDSGKGKAKNMNWRNNLIRNKDIRRKLKVFNWNYRITDKRNNCVGLVRRNGNYT